MAVSSSPRISSSVSILSLCFLIVSEVPSKTWEKESNPRYGDTTVPPQGQQTGNPSFVVLHEHALSLLQCMYINLSYLNWLTEVSKLLCTLQIFIVILLCKCIKVMGRIWKLLIGKFLYTKYHWNPGIVKKLLKPSKNKSQCWSKLFSVSNKFWYEGKI